MGLQKGESMKIQSQTISASMVGARGGQGEVEQSGCTTSVVPVLLLFLFDTHLLGSELNNKKK